ncbi:MAG: FAD-dependent oxidoreductase [archaeon]
MAITKKSSVAIIGSGPAGLICAIQLANNGFNVKVFDELKEFGGMLAYGVPEFRIPLKTIQKKINDAKKLGVKFEHKKIFSIKSLLKKFDYVVIAIGAGKGIKARIEGEKNNNIIDALEFLSKAKLENEKMVSEKDNVAIIGGGNSAIDAARTAKKQGAHVTIIYRRTESEMPALRTEIESARKEGIHFEFLRHPLEYNPKGNKKINVTCAEMILSGTDEQGRKKPVETGKTCSYAHTKVILAIGQQHNFSWLEKEGIKTNGKTITVNENNETSLKKVYACGDCVTGPKTIAQATLSGIKTAQTIITELVLE